MSATIAAIYRYPVKGLSPEPLDRVALAAGECLPHDRRFALALPATVFDAAHPQWLAKTHFAMLMRDESLAQLHTRFDAESGVFAASRGGREVLRETMITPAGQSRIGAFFTEFLGGSVEGPLRVIEAPGHAFADARPKPNATTEKYVSLINRASLAALEAALGAALDPLRFRANFYFDGPPAWAELDWIGAEIAVGTARLRVLSPITRCAATEVNPTTAERDIDTVGALRRHFGHNLMGIYAEVASGGAVATGDSLVPSRS